MLRHWGNDIIWAFGGIIQRVEQSGPLGQPFMLMIPWKIGLESLPEGQWSVRKYQ